MTAMRQDARPTSRDATRNTDVRHQQPGAAHGGGKDVKEAEGEAKKAASFWQKVNEDWVLNFAGMLAYNYLTVITPILLAVLAIAGFVLGALSPATYHTFVATLGSHFPGGQGQQIVNATLTALQKEAGILLIISVITAIFTGSRLFVTLDNCFAVIYRVDVRPVIQQNIMAILMMVLFLALAPIAFFASSVPGLVLQFVLPAGIQRNPFVLTIEGFIAGTVVGFLLFGAIYFVVPNYKVSWKTTWPGALAAAVLLNLFEALFPIYQGVFLKNAGYGSAAGFAVVVLIFLYYIGVITLIGAEMNAWVADLRPLGATLPQLFRNERRAGTGNAHGAPTTGVSRTPQKKGDTPRRPGQGGALQHQGEDTGRSGEARGTTGRETPREAQRGPTHALVASALEPSASAPEGQARHADHETQRDHASHADHQRQAAQPRHQPAPMPSGGGKVTRIARPVAALTTMGAILGAGAALALREMSRTPTTA